MQSTWMVARNSGLENAYAQELVFMHRLEYIEENGSFSVPGDDEECRLQVAMPAVVSFDE
jgi:hypothetical protein